jgi:hypothetical protein
MAEITFPLSQRERGWGVGEIVVFQERDLIGKHFTLIPNPSPSGRREYWLNFI